MQARIAHFCHVCLELLYAALKAAFSVGLLHVRATLAHVVSLPACLVCSRRRRSQQCNLRLSSALDLTVSQLVTVSAQSDSSKSDM